MDLSIIIVSWNVRDLLARCLESIAAAPSTVVTAQTTPDAAPPDATLQVEVIVVDSASSDGSAELIRERFPWVRLIAETENVGFTRGNNIALQVAQGQHLLLLNPDTIVHDDALTILVDYLDMHPQTGIVGPHVLNEDGMTQSTRRRFPTPITALFESTWLQAYAPRRILDDFYMSDQPDEATFEVDWVQGCALMARREVYEQIGPLDPGYIMFSEELDWCKRAKQSGWRMAYVGQARITHYGGKSTEQVQTNKHIYFQQSKIRYFRKFHGRGVAFALRVFLLLSYGAQLLLESIKMLLGHKRPLRQERIRSYLGVMRALAFDRQP